MNERILLRNNVTVLGEGFKTMIFAHGFGCDQNMWRYIWPAFKQDYEIVLFDYVGCGKSDLTAYNHKRYGKLNGYVEDVLDIASAKDLENAVFVGHSVSSIIGILAALKEPSYFSHLVLVGPSPRYINDSKGYVGGFEKSQILELLDTMESNYIDWANLLGPALMKNPDRPELAEELTASICSADPVMAGNFARATFLSDNRDDLSKIQHPSLILQCTDDLMAPRQVGQYVHGQIKNSVLKIMKATGHCPHMSAPEETIQVMKEYLNPRVGHQ
jgi:sigma-B regulation protein RsbQ